MLQQRSDGGNALRRIVAGLALAFLLSACGGEPPLPPLPEDAVILAFGDSLTHGTGASPGESYPAVLEGLTGRRVVNAGVPGEVSAAGRQRLASLLEQHRPDLLLLCHGGNDLLRKLDRDRLRENLQAMVQTARQRDIPVVLIGVPRPALLLLESDDIYPALAAELGIPFEGELLAEIIGDSGLKADQVHPNAAGYRELAEGIAELLDRHGAI